MAHPQKLITDVTVAGVSGGRTLDERVPHAWIVLSHNGRKLGRENVIMALDKWHKENLSRYKWLRGGIEIVAEVRVCVFMVSLNPFRCPVTDTEVTDWQDTTTCAPRSI